MRRPSLLLAVLSLLLAACGGHPEVQGAFTVNPRSTAEVNVFGEDSVVFELDGRGGPPLELITLDPDDPTRVLGREALAGDGAFRMRTAGPQLYHLVNGSADACTLSYKVEAKAGAGFSAMTR